MLTGMPAPVGEKVRIICELKIETRVRSYSVSTTSIRGFVC
jgi:hypothetical protein